MAGLSSLCRRKAPAFLFWRGTEASHGSFHERDTSALNLAFGVMWALTSADRFRTSCVCEVALFETQDDRDAEVGSIAVINGITHRLRDGFKEKRPGPRSSNRALLGPTRAEPNRQRCAAGRSIKFKSETLCESNLRCARNIFCGTAMNYG